MLKSGHTKPSSLDTFTWCAHIYLSTFLGGGWIPDSLKQYFWQLIEMKLLKLEKAHYHVLSEVMKRKSLDYARFYCYASCQTPQKTELNGETSIYCSLFFGKCFETPCCSNSHDTLKQLIITEMFHKHSWKYLPNKEIGLHV